LFTASFFVVLTASTFSLSVSTISVLLIWDKALLVASAKFISFVLISLLGSVDLLPF